LGNGLITATEGLYETAYRGLETFLKLVFGKFRNVEGYDFFGAIKFF